MLGRVLYITSTHNCSLCGIHRAERRPTEPPALARLLAHRSRQPGRLGSPRSGCTGRAFQPPPTLVKQDESIVLFYNEVNDSDRWT